MNKLENDLEIFKDKFLENLNIITKSGLNELVVDSVQFVNKGIVLYEVLCESLPVDSIILSDDYKKNNILYIFQLENEEFPRGISSTLLYSLIKKSLFISLDENARIPEFYSDINMIQSTFINTFFLKTDQVVFMSFLLNVENFPFEFGLVFSVSDFLNLGNTKVLF